MLPKLYFCLVISILVSVCTSDSDDNDPASRPIDKNGYVMFCPCMGRFGNQADQFLGSLMFAKHLDRTLILPPWVEYPPGSVRSVQVPFDKYFKPESVANYHRVILMHDFMNFLAPKVWPVGKRIAFCYSERSGTTDKDCNARDGNPFDSFWATYNINFDSSEFFTPLYYNTEYDSAAREWKRRYPADRFPVMAFTGAPSPYPVQPAAVPLHQYAFKYSDFITFKANAFINENLPRPYVAIHLRNGIDWKSACDHVKNVEGKNQHIFDSGQCLGQNFERGPLKYELCFPSASTIVNQVARAVVKYGAKSIFVATDSDDMKDRIRNKLRSGKSNSNIAFIRNPDSQDVHLDLAIMGEADVLIANCVSSFSAFAVRHRTASQKPTQYFGVADQAAAKNSHSSDEL